MMTTIDHGTIRLMDDVRATIQNIEGDAVLAGQLFAEGTPASSDRAKAILRSCAVARCALMGRIERHLAATNA